MPAGWIDPNGKSIEVDDSGTEDAISKGWIRWADTDDEADIECLDDPAVIRRAIDFIEEMGYNDCIVNIDLVDRTRKTTAYTPYLTSAAKALHWLRERLHTAQMESVPVSFHQFVRKI